MNSIAVTKKALAVVFLLILFPLSSRGGVMAGQMLSTEGISGQTGKGIVQIVRSPQKGILTSSKIGRENQMRLAISEKLPMFLQRMIHRRIQYQRQSEYLMYLLEGIGKNGFEASSLARQLDSEGTMVRDAYFRYAQTQPHDQLHFLQQQKDFVMVMVRHIQTVKNQSPVMHQQNLKFFSELISRMKSISAVSIAENKPLVTMERKKHNDQFVIPRQLLLAGNQGSLGAILDALKTSSYDIHPNVLNRFIRQVRILFSTSV